MRLRIIALYLWVFVLIGTVMLSVVRQARGQNPFILGMMAQRQAAVPFVPTNSPSGEGSAVIFWSRGDYVTTNGGNTLDFINISGGNTTWDLTNQAATSKWPLPSGSNTWIFNDVSAHHLKSVNFSATVPWEIWYITKLRGTNASANNSYLFDSVDGTTRSQLLANSGGLGITSGGSQSFPTLATYTNAWIAYCLSIGNSSGGTARFITNNVVVNSALGMTLGENGLTVNARRDAAGIATFGCYQELAEIIVYSQTNTPTQRSNIYWYLKNTSTVCKNLGLP